ISRTPFGCPSVGDRWFTDRCRCFTGGAAQQSVCPGETPLHQGTGRSDRRIRPTGRHSHHQICHSVGFLLVLITGLVDAQLRLHGSTNKLLASTVLALSSEARRSATGALALQDTGRDRREEY